jgi:hypothetical protein
MPDSEAWTAIGTVAMAVTTFVVVLQGGWNRRDDERRHRDGLRPICLLTPFDGVDPRPYRSELLAVDTDASRPGFGIIEVRCALRNIGPGPALNLRIALRIHTLGGYETEGCELGPLHAGEVRGSASEPLRVAVSLHPPLQDQEFAQIPGGPWEIILTYDDVFRAKLLLAAPEASASNEPPLWGHHTICTKSYAKPRCRRRMWNWASKLSRRSVSLTAYATIDTTQSSYRQLRPQPEPLPRSARPYA